MSCGKCLQFCINHSFLLNLSKSKNYDDEFILHFKKIKPQLEAILQYYEKYDEKCAETFRKSNIKDYTKNFVLKLSQYLNLSCDCSYGILKSYLLNDGKLDDSDLQSMLNRGYNTISLLQKIKKYYYEERLSLIRLIRYAFCDWKEEFHVLSTIVFSASKCDTKKSLFLKLVKSYHNLVDAKYHENTIYEYRDESSEDEFIIRNFEEQIEMLETMLIGAYSMKECTDKEVFRQTLDAFMVTGLCTEIQVSKMLISRTYVKTIIDRISMLQSLILIELSSMWTILVGEKQKTESHFLAADPKLLSELNSIVKKLGCRPSHCILMLFMSLVHQRFPGDHGLHLVDANQMAQTSIVKMGLFQFIHTLLTTKPYMISTSEGSYLGLIAHCILFDLMSLLCNEIHLNSLDQNVRQDLVKVMCILLRPIIAFSDTQPLNKGFMKMLEDLSLSFPSDLSMLRVVGFLIKKTSNDDIQEEEEQEDNQKSVINNNNKIITIISDYLDNLSWFCDSRCIDLECLRVIETSHFSGDIENTNVVKQCRLVSPYQPYRTARTTITLDTQVEGYFVDNSAVWAVHYSAWNIILAEVELTCALINQSSDGILNHVNNMGPSNLNSISDQLERLEIVLDFLCISLQNNLKQSLVIDIFRQLWTLVENDSIFVEGCEPVLVKLIDLAGLILANYKDIESISRIVNTQNLFPLAHSYGERIVTNQSVVHKIWTMEPTQINIAVVQSYLKFNISLIQCEKYLETDVGIIPSSLIFGSIIFVVRSVLENVNRVTQINCIADLGVDALVFLNEIMSIKPKSYLALSEIRKSRLELIQQVTHEMLVKSPTALKTILSMSSVDVETLVRQSNLSNQMIAVYGTEEKLGQLVWLALTMVKYVFTGPNTDMDAGTDVKDDTKQASGDISIENGASVLLKILDSPMENELNSESAGGASLRSSMVRSSVSTQKRLRRHMTHCQQYVLSMLEFLSYPYSIKISRMSLEVLRLIVQNTDISIVACLGEKTSFIRDMLRRLFQSTMEDQIVRANLFNFLSECVMRGRHGVLQLISQSKPDFADSDDKASTGTVIDLATVSKSDESCCYQSALDIMRDFQIDDEVSVKLCCSVCRFLSSLWIKECYPTTDLLKKINIWQNVLVPLTKCLESINQSLNPISDPILELIGNLYGIFAMELYSTSLMPNTHKEEDDFNKSLQQLFHKGMFIDFLNLFNRSNIENQLCKLNRYLKIILQPISWWKTLLVTSLAVTTTESCLSKNLTSETQSKLVLNILQSIMNLIDVSVIVENSQDLDVVLDQLSSCVLVIINKISRLLSVDQNIEIAQQLENVLIAMLPSHNVMFHVRHSDLLSSYVLLFQHSRNSKVLNARQLRFESLVHSYLVVLTTRLCPNKLEANALVQAVNLCITADMLNTTTSVSNDWVVRLANDGILQNCMVLLNDCLKNNELGVLPQNLLLLLLRVAHTQLGTSRILQSDLLCTLETYFCFDETDNNCVKFLVQLLQLTEVIMVKGGHRAHDFMFRLFLTHWEQLDNVIIQGCTRLLRPVVSAEDYNQIGSFLTIGKYVLGVIFNLLPVRGSWSLYWPESLIARVGQLVDICTNSVAIVLSKPQELFPHNSVYIIHSNRSRITKQVSFGGGENTKRKLDNLSLLTDEDDITSRHLKLKKSSSELESILYNLLHTCLLVYSRSTALMGENCIYEGIDYNGTLLMDYFGDIRQEKCDLALSYGCLFSILSSTHCLLRDDIAPLSIGNDKITFNNDLIRQIHEIAVSIIVSHSVVYLAKFVSNKVNRNTFLTNIKSELNYYLNEFARTRRRNTMSANSPIVNPKITSTPYSKHVSHTVTESIDLFRNGLDQFKKALDLI